MAKTTSVKYTCECGKSFRVAQEKIGSGMKCPKCKRPIGEGGAGGADEDQPSRPTSARKRTQSRRAPASSRVRRKERAPEPEPTPEPESIDEPDDADEEEPMSSSTRSSSRTRRGGGATREAAPERSRRGGRSVEGYSALEKVASFSSLFGILLFVACDIVATYFIVKGPAAVMATSAKQAHMYAVMFGVLGIISFVFLFVVGQFARVLLALVDLMGDVRSRVSAHLADED